MTDLTALERYAELTTWIRELSAPEITADIGAENYRKQLLKNFTHIGEIAHINDGILAQNVYPVLEQEGLLSEDDARNLRIFNDALLDGRNLKNLDTPVMYLCAERLMKHAELKGDLAELISVCLDVIMASYTMLFMTIRLYPCSDICFQYRAQGLAAANRVLSFLPKEVFQTLPDDNTKEKVLIVSRYIFSMFSRQDMFGDDAINQSDFDVLYRSLLLADDPFYTTNAPQYDWRNHRFRAMQYICDLTERNNERGFSKALLQKIRQVALDMEALWKSDETFFGRLAPREVVELLLARTGYLAGETDVKTYRNTLLDLMRRRNDRDFSYQSILINVSVPIEYMRTFRDVAPTQEDKIHIGGFYRNLIGYIHHMPKRDSITFLLTDLSEILKSFIAIEGGVTFEELCLSLLAALHPPTYVHSNTVADLSVCLAGHLYQKRPDLFTASVSDDQAKETPPDETAVSDFVRHAALLHDVGKLFIVETIITYGRPLFDLEFDWVRIHPEIGAYLLSLYPQTARYAEIAKYHHKWFNDTAGYPPEAAYASSKDKTVICIVSMADCLDAATDVVGRSYKEGKSFAEFLQEAREEKGKRFAPYLVDLLEDEAVQKDIESILLAGRDENYRNAYRIMKGV